MKRILSQWDIVSILSMDGVSSLDSSLVNTDEKKDARTSAFLLSVVADNLMLSSRYVRSHTPDLILVLDWTLDQISLGCCLTEAAIFSNSF